MSKKKKSLKERILAEMVVDDHIYKITKEIFGEVQKRKAYLKEKFLNMTDWQIWDYIEKRVKEEIGWRG
ncbi:MAG: hypothetical protein DRN14_04075 [Thermoplasmata archaeon]|nr:MAG: hypothetical protein DRN14_04075 [Thermoplasmata archaeon]